MRSSIPNRQRMRICPVSRPAGASPSRRLKPQADAGNKASIDVEARRTVQEVHLAVEYPAPFDEASHAAAFGAQSEQRAVIAELNFLGIPAGARQIDLIGLDAVLDSTVHPGRRSPPVPEK